MMGDEPGASTALCNKPPKSHLVPQLIKNTRGARARTACMESNFDAKTMIYQQPISFALSRLKGSLFPAAHFDISLGTVYGEGTPS